MPAVPKAVEEGRVRVEELSETALNARLAAGARNLPSLPTRGLLGTDLIDINENLETFEDPFGGRDPRRVPRARPRRRARPRPPCRRARQRPVRADDRVARPRDLPQGGAEDDRDGRGDRRLRGAAAEPRTAPCSPASASTRSSRCPTARTRRRSPALRLRRALPPRLDKASRDDETTDAFLDTYVRARRPRPTTSTPSAASTSQGRGPG